MAEGSTGQGHEAAQSWAGKTEAAAEVAAAADTY